MNEYKLALYMVVIIQLYMVILQVRHTPRLVLHSRQWSGLPFWLA